MSCAASYSHGRGDFSLVKVKNVSELSNVENAYSGEWTQSSICLVYDVQTPEKV